MNYRQKFKIVVRTHRNYKNKTTKTLGVLYKTRQFLNGKALYLIINSLLMNNVRYCLLCLGREKKTCIKDINVLINRALRCIHYNKYDYIGCKRIKNS